MGDKLAVLMPCLIEKVEFRHMFMKVDLVL